MTSSLHERMTGPAKCGHKKMTTGVNCINNMNRGYGYEFKDQNCGTASERIDIVKEIKSLIIELENDNVPTEIIINRLGDPKELAKAYLGNLLANSKGFSWNRILIICAFYSIVGFSGMIVIPCLAIIAPVFMICGIATPILAAIKMIDYIFSLGIPYMQNIGILLDGLVELNPIVEFICCVPVGALLYFAGRGLWKLLVYYCRKVSKTKQSLSI